MCKELRASKLSSLKVDIVFLGVFAINETTGVMIVAKKLDRESVHAHSLIVSAKDHGTPSLSNNATVKIDVSDTNDENPVLIIDRTTFEIMEVVYITIKPDGSATEANEDYLFSIYSINTKGNLD